MKKILFLLVIAVAFASCGEYNKILKSTDYEMKYAYAKKYFNEKKYGRAITLLEELVPIMRGTVNAEESLFLLAQSFYYDRDYLSATQYYTAYFNTYPKGEYAETARYNAAYGMYLDSPDVRLDQSSTYKAIQEFQTFLEMYPQSDKAKLAQDCMFELQEKLAYKEYLAAKLYYNLGNYMGNNYEACVITAREALKSYPFSKLTEEFQILILRARFDLAENSIEDRQPLRYRDVIDEYYNYLNMFPEGKYQRESQNYYRKAMRATGQEISESVIENTETITQ